VNLACCHEKIGLRTFLNDDFDAGEGSAPLSSAFADLPMTTPKSGFRIRDVPEVMFVSPFLENETSRQMVCGVSIFYSMLENTS
jgi:hypothetical protein